MSRTRGWLLFILVLFISAEVRASGLYFTERGVHGLARGGAYVAGAQGLDAVGYNPAGIQGTGVHGDVAQLFMDLRYRRELSIESGSGQIQTVRSPLVRGQSDLIPLPTLVLGYTTPSEELSVAAGIYTPTFALMSFPGEVNGQPSPARYALDGLTDSRLVLMGAWLAYRPHPQWAIGGGIHALAGTFRSSLAFSLSLPDRLLAAPEDPDYDAYGRISVGPFVAPSAGVGLQFSPLSQLRMGLSADLPTWIDSSSTFDVRLPTAAVFDTVSVRGRRADVRLRLPAVLRAGLEVRPTERLAVEAAYVREFWSLHDQISIDPDNVRIEGIPGGPPSIALPVIRIERSYRDASSFRLGGELTGEFRGHGWSLRTGAAYEQSAVPKAYVSLSSLDFDKVVLSVGVAAKVTERLRLDVTYAHLFMDSLVVDPASARIERVAPLAGNAKGESINGGRYVAHADLLSAGFSFWFP